jgi:hypothetical protein
VIQCTLEADVSFQLAWDVLYKGKRETPKGQRSLAVVPPELVHSDANAIANAAFVECEDVRDFYAKHVRPLLDRAAQSNRGDVTVHGAALRAQAWLITLGRLNDPSHFQSALAGTRSLFEIAIDCALLLHDPSEHSSAMIVAWERSALLASAEKTASYYERTRRTVADGHKERLALVLREKASIEALRARTWPNVFALDHRTSLG